MRWRSKRLDGLTIRGQVDPDVHREEVIAFPLGAVLGRELLRRHLDLGDWYLRHGLHRIEAH